MTVKAPTCKICGEMHWSNQPHKWDTEAAPPRIRPAAESPQELAKRARETLDKVEHKLATRPSKVKKPKRKRPAK